MPVPVPVRLLSTNKTWQNARLWHHIVSAYFLYSLTVRELNKRDLALLFPRSVSLFNKELSLPLSTLLQGDQGRWTAVSAVLVFVLIFLIMVGSPTREGVIMVRSPTREGVSTTEVSENPGKNLERIITWSA